ncbi:hypothetical protein RB195_002673 [Necator americanus]|uniref:Reverse transcriptase domain-containing protein n=1 Tax=Necator americanus TaxID=51031 RepID=A0ABR1DK47_NECAM
MRELPARGRSRPKKLVAIANKIHAQETRWKGSKLRELGDGYKLINHDTSNRNGVGVILNEGRTPDVWQTFVTLNIWKGEGGIADYTMYRPIQLLCHTMKAFERVLEARLRTIASVSLNSCVFLKEHAAL